MASLPFGLSVHHFVSSVGADAGFAALIAVAILVLLYFAQARETATLRTRADEAGLRVQELEAQVGDLSDQLAALPAEISVRAASPRVAAAYGGTQGQIAGVPAAARADGGLLPPAAPAGVAGPALAAATRLIPDSIRSTPEFEPASTAARSSNGSSRPVVAASAATVQRSVETDAHPPPRPVAAPPRTGGGAGRATGGPYGRPGGAGQPRPGAGQARPGGPPPGTPTRPPAGRSRGRLVLGALVGAVALAAVAAGVIILTGGSSKSHRSTTQSSANAAQTTRRTASVSAVVPSTVTVSVLNGTDMQGLAGEVAGKLKAQGYRKGAVTNASDQTRTSTVIQYLPHDQPDALAVASALKLRQSAVQPIDSATQKIACSASPLGCNSAVFVTVGRDLATPQ